MVQRFSSKEEAQADAYERLRLEKDVPFRPTGYCYDDFDGIIRSARQYLGRWDYRTPHAVQGTVVIMQKPTPTRKSYTTFSQHDGRWYYNYPKPPYLLYQRYAWGNAETIYICEGERTSDAVEALGLPATTSLGGPFEAKKSDWTPLKDKKVVILSDYDDKGLNYAREVAQLCLGVGALSAKIVMVPGVKMGEGPCEWIDNVRAASGDEAVLPELQKLIDAAEFVEHAPPVPEPPEGVQLELKSIADFQPAPQKWVFDRVIPQGKLTVLMGESGIGKSLALMEIAAKVTRGLTGPEDDQPQEPGSVILMAAEDSVAENIRPRLEAAQADLSKVSVIPGFTEMDAHTGLQLAWEFQLDRDVSLLESKLKYLQQTGANVRLLVIDPIDRFLESSKKKAKAIIESLSVRLATLAAETGVAIVVTTKLPRGVKGTSKLGQSMRRAVDMGPFEAAARSVWMVGKDLENQNRRFLLPVKTNLCELPKSLAFQIENGVIKWEPERAAVTGDQYLAKCEEYFHKQKPTVRDAELKINHAIAWLKFELSDGPLGALYVIKDARENGISVATLTRAKARLGCLSCKTSFAGIWMWKLRDEEVPKETEEPDEDEVEAEADELSATADLDEGAQGDQGAQADEEVPLAEGAQDNHQEAQGDEGVQVGEGAYIFQAGIHVRSEGMHADEGAQFDQGVHVENTESMKQD